MSITETTQTEKRSAEVESTVSDSEFGQHDQLDEMQLKSISKSAILGLMFAVVTLISMWICKIMWENWGLSIFLAIAAIAFGLLGWIKVKRYPDEAYGAKIALASIAIGIFGFVGSIAIQWYVYNTEVPDGYVRADWGNLQLKSGSSETYSKLAEQYDGKKVFFKGYVRPDLKKKGIKKFIMVPDFGTCCFGEAPDMTDCIAVDIITDDTVEANFRIRKLAGTFKLHKMTKRTSKKEVPRVVYELHADYVK